MNAKVTQISVNPNGGVPKNRVSHARFGFERVEGDKQRHLKFHGGPTRAVCLYSQEIIETLQDEGHPIVAGATGENLTISGLDWEKIVPETRLQIGDTLLEVTSYTTPCKNIASAFKAGDFMRISQKMHPGQSRVYARVLTEGMVSEGDEVRVVA